jgi:hypothetical protein
LGVVLRSAKTDQRGPQRHVDRRVTVFLHFLLHFSFLFVEKLLFGVHSSLVITLLRSLFRALLGFVSRQQAEEYLQASFMLTLNH